VGGFLAVLAVSAPGAWGQAWRRPPETGFVFPAGARAGEASEVTIGGQYLKDITAVLISGEGVRAEVIEYDRPPTQKELMAMREVWQKAQKKIRADTKAGKKLNYRQALNRLVVEMAKAKGITDKQVEAFREFRRRRADPKHQLNPQLSESAKVRVTIAADAEPGFRELRVTTGNGLSCPLRFHVGRLPECREAEPNDNPAAATAVPSLPIVLNGQITPGDVDRFRLAGRQGQKLVVAVAARDLIPYLADAVPGWFQATVALYDADGREAAYADDYRFNPDPVLLYSIPRDGDYVLEIRDAIYRGREDFVYRITVGELPFVSSIFPMGAGRGKKTTVTVQGWNLPPDQRKLDVSRAETGLRPLRVGDGGTVSSPVPFAVGDLPECREQERNDNGAGAMKVKLPLTVNGRIDRPGDWDVFRFHARRGDRIVAEVNARRLGSPLDSLLKLTDAAGDVLAVNDDHEDKAAGLVTHHADSLLSVTLAKTGEYLLWLGDTQGKGGEAYGYRLRLGPNRPDFELRIVPSALNARGGTTVPVTVHALRKDGFSQDITLRLVDAPEGFALSGWLPAGREAARLTLTVPSKPKDTVTRLRLAGTATVGGREIRRLAVPADDRMQAFLYRHLVPAADWTVAVAPIRWNRPQWTIMAPRPVKLKAGGTGLIRVRIPKRGPVGQARLELNDPPKGVRIQKVSRTAEGVAVLLAVEAGKAKEGLKGNLIFNATLIRKPPPKTDTRPRAKLRPILLGALPAVPFEIVGK